MKKLFRKIAIIGTLSGMLFGLEGCTGDLLSVFRLMPGRP